MNKYDPRNITELHEAIDQLLDQPFPQNCPHCANPRHMIKLAASLGWHSAAAVYQNKAVKDVAELLTTIADTQQGLKSRGD